MMKVFQKSRRLLWIGGSGERMSGDNSSELMGLIVHVTVTTPTPSGNCGYVWFFVLATFLIS